MAPVSQPQSPGTRGPLPTYQTLQQRPVALGCCGRAGQARPDDAEVFFHRFCLGAYTCESGASGV